MSITVAVVGGSGRIGSTVTRAFIDALKQGNIREVRVTTRKISDKTDTLAAKGAKVFEVDYASEESLSAALCGVTVVINAVGVWKYEGTRDTSALLLEAMGKAGVAVYFPSEFGTNHYSRLKGYPHPKFTEKQDHIKAAQAVGLKVVALFSLAMNLAFPRWFGPDVTRCEHYGDGNTRIALITFSDLGKFVVQAAIQAVADPKGFPDRLEIYSDLKTIREYAEIFERVSGKKSMIEYVPLEPAREAYKNSPDSFQHHQLVTILMGEGVYDFTGSTENGNQRLNPNESIWKLTNAEEFLKQLVAGNFAKIE